MVRFFYISNTVPISKLIKSLVDDLSGEYQLCRAYKVHGPNEDGIVDIARIKIIIETLVNEMSDQVFTVTDLSADDDPLKLTTMNDIDGEREPKNSYSEKTGIQQ